MKALPRALVAALLAAALPGVAMAQVVPLHLVTEPEGSGVRIRVVGHDVPTCDVGFVLEVVHSAATGRSRSVQRGTARAQPGAPRTFATASLANVRAKDWAARLSVGPCGASKNYSQSSGEGWTNLGEP